MKCTQCGASVSADDKFCGSCGHPVKAAAAANPAPPPKPPAAAKKPAAEANEPPRVAPASAPPKVTPAKDNTLIWVGAAALIVVAVLFFYNSGSDEPQTLGGSPVGADNSDYCDRVRAAEARGEPPPPSVAPGVEC